MQNRNFDSSAHTKRAQGRMLYANYLIRNTSVNVNPGLIARPLATGSPIGSGSGVNYANYLEEVIQGAVNTTLEEQQEIINRNFPTPPAPPPSLLITPDPDPQDTTSWGYLVLYVGVGDTYHYIMYDDSTRLWATYDSGLNAYGDYYSDYFLESIPNGFAYGFTGPVDNEDYRKYIIQYVDYDGQAMDYIEYPELNYHDYSINQYLTFFYYDDPVDGVLTINQYNNETHFLQTVKYPSYNPYGVDNYIVLRTAVYFILTNDYTTYDHFIWNINDTQPTLLFTSYDYDLQYFNFYDHIVITMSSDGLTNDKIYCIEGNKTVHTYNLPNSENYTNVGNLDNWGPYEKYMRFNVYNNATDSIDYFLFRSLPDLTPATILQNLTTQGYINGFNYSSDTYQYKTGVTPTYVLIESEAVPYYIKTGGTLPLFDGNGNGNHIIMQIDTNNDNTIVPNDTKNYGSHLNTNLSRYDTRRYGYLISPINVYPHASTAFISDIGDTSIDGYLHLYIYEYVTQSGYSIDSKTNGIYSTTSGGRHGTYYTRQAYGISGSASACHVFFTIESENWASTVTNVSLDLDINTNISYHASIGVTGYNIIVCHVLLSAYDGGVGTFIENSDIQAFLAAYVENAYLMSDENDFLTIDMVGFKHWQQSHDYTNLIPHFYKYTYDFNYSYFNNSFANGKIHCCFEGQNVITKEITGSTQFYSNAITVNNAGLTLLLQDDYNLVSYLVNPTIDISYNIFDMNNFNSIDNSHYIVRRSSDNYTIYWIPLFSSEYQIVVVSPNNTPIVNEATGGYLVQGQLSKDSIIIVTDTYIYVIVNGVLTKLTASDYTNNDWSIYTPYPDLANGCVAFFYLDGDSYLYNIITNDTTYTGTFSISSIPLPYLNSSAMIKDCVIHMYSGDNTVYIIAAYSDGTIDEFTVPSDQGQSWYSDNYFSSGENCFYLVIRDDNNYGIMSLVRYTLRTEVPGNGTYVIETTSFVDVPYYPDYNFSTYNYSVD